jgi:polyhydroxyalkanoate synthesis regulator phasin
MMDLFRKTLLAGIGAAFMTKEKLDELGRKLMEDFNASESEAKKFVDEMTKMSEDARNAMGKTVDDMVGKAIGGLDIPTRKEFDALKERVACLEEKIENQKSQE